MASSTQPGRAVEGREAVEKFTWLNHPTYMFRAPAVCRAPCWLWGFQCFLRKWFQWKVGEGSQVLRVSGGDVQRGNGSTRCRGTTDWSVKLDRASGARENFLVGWENHWQWRGKSPNEENEGAREGRVNSEADALNEVVARAFWTQSTLLQWAHFGGYHFGWCQLLAVTALLISAPRTRWPRECVGHQMLSTSLNTFGVSHYCLLVIHFLPELSSQGAPGNLGTFLSDRWGSNLAQRFEECHGSFDVSLLPLCWPTSVGICDSILSQTNSVLRNVSAFQRPSVYSSA